MKNTYLIDTNIIVYAYNEDADKHQLAKSVLESALNKNIDAYLADKNLFEFFAIITDSRRVEKPVTPEIASEAVNFLLNSPIKILYPTHHTMTTTLELIKKYKISKQNIFDLILVSMMLENKIETILTANEADFKKYDQISVENPFKKEQY